MTGGPGTRATHRATPLEPCQMYRFSPGSCLELPIKRWLYQPAQRQCSGTTFLNRRAVASERVAPESVAPAAVTALFSFACSASSPAWTDSAKKSSEGGASLLVWTDSAKTRRRAASVLRIQIYGVMRRLHAKAEHRPRQVVLAPVRGFALGVTPGLHPVRPMATRDPMWICIRFVRWQILRGPPLGPYWCVHGRPGCGGLWLYLGLWTAQ